MLDIVTVRANESQAILCWVRNAWPAEAALSRINRDETYQLTLDFFELDHRLQSVTVHCRPNDPLSWKVAG